MSKEKLTWQEVTITLKDHGVKKVTVNYSGSGDSGGIDEISYFDKEEKEIRHDDIKIDHDAVQDLCYPLLDGIEDWYNNEGGDGVITIDLDTLKYHIVNNVNIIEQETFNHKGSIKKIMKNE